ncbi:MAG TPA: hypothetical protein PLB89_12670 [Flavobacteriales bacterium]|nr:hypothetical protein [Flavobacteriales bacterium]
MRRVPVILLLLAVLAAAGWTLLRWNRAAIAPDDPWRAIPDRSAVVIAVPDAWTTWDRFTHTSQLWSTFEKVPDLAALGRLMARTSERAENDAALRTALEDVTLVISVTRTGGDQVDLLFACVPKAADTSPLQAFAELLKADAATAQALAHGDVVQVRPDTALPALSLSIKNGLWLLASSPAMMDEAMLQLKSGKSIMQDPLLTAARNTLGGGSDAHVLIHLERARSLLSTWWTPRTIDALEMPTGWAALDLRARPDAFLLSGLVLPDAPHSVLAVIDHQGTGRNDLARWLPAEVTQWDVQQVSDAERFLSECGTANDTDLTTFGPALFNWVHGSIGTATGTTIEGKSVAKWALFQTEDPESAVEELTRLCPEGKVCDTLAYRGTRLTHLLRANAHERLLGAAYADLIDPWWCALGDVIVFSADPVALRTAVDAWNDGRTLAEDARTAAWSDRIASTSGRTMRWDIARCRNTLANGMKPSAATIFDAYSTLWQQLGGLSVQLSPAQHGHMHVAIGLQQAPVEERSTGVLWSTPLATTVTRKPDIVRNHTNNTLEVLVQDADHKIHLLGSTGKALWVHPLDGPILGAVHQVDRFQNGKLQLLFNTAGRIYLIDRNGKDVGGFPVSLKEKATAPLAVFDYDDQRDYRVLLPVADGKILNYGLDGAMTKGWDPPRLTAPSSNAVEHLRIQNKDHLLFVDGNGKLLVFDRRGVRREGFSVTLAPTAQITAVHAGLDLPSTRIWWSDTSGVLMQTRLEGSQTVMSLGGPRKFMLGDVGDDGQYDLLCTVADSLILTHGTKEVFARSFGERLTIAPRLYKLDKGPSAIGVVLPEREQVILIDAQGRDLDGMPMRGATSFSIADLNLDGKLELITATADGHVVAYQLH